MRLSSLLLLVLGCDRATDPSPLDSTPEDTPPTDPPDTDRPDTDRPDTDDTDRTPPPPPQPPTSWGAGFTDLSGPWLGPDAFPVEVGSAADFRGPQEAPGIFAQLDADPAIEVIVGASRIYWSEAPTHVRVYEYDPTTGALTRRPDEEARHHGGTLDVPYGAMDLDGDGHIDLLAEDGERLVRWGRGDGTFERGPEAGLPPDLELLDVGANLYPFDVDHDGWLDLMAGDANCVAGLMPFQRTGPRSYRWRPEWIVETTADLQVASLVAAPYPAAGGELWLAQGNPCDLADAHPGFYVRQPGGPGDEPSLVATDLTPADATWQRVPTWFGLPFTAVAPMGLGVHDWDDDGLFDVTLVLGTTWLGVLQTQPDGTFHDLSAQLAIPAGLVGPQYPYVEFAWSVAHPDLDADGRPDTILTIGDDFTSFVQLHKDMAQMLFWNGGPTRHIEVTQSVGFPIAGSFHGLFPDDLDGDGDLDLIVGGYGDPPRLLRNDIDLGNRGLVIKLRGTTSNHLGVGATVQVTAPSLPPRTAWMGDQGNMSCRPPPLVSFGLGAADAASEVRVRWPSGFEQVVTDVAAGAVTLEEPPTLTVRSTTRRAPADGVTEIELVATPRHPDGTRDDAPTVTWRTFGTPATTRTWSDADGHHLALRSSAAGSTVVEASFDGVPVEVRPRLWWGATP